MLAIVLAIGTTIVILLLLEISEWIGLSNFTAKEFFSMVADDQDLTGKENL